MIKLRWHDLPPRVRQGILLGAAAEGVAKLAALVDLVRRPASQVRGSKGRWAAALILVNSCGALPIVYFRKGRHPNQ
ncbi:MAG: hypothetical protein JWM40_2533 [Frankiales bacterium]|nr:hypothetical protein [Frankiales bacterium]